MFLTSDEIAKSKHVIAVKREGARAPAKEVLVVVEFVLGGEPQ